MEVQNVQKKIAAALGTERADLVVKNARIFNVFTEDFERADLAVSEGVIVGIGTYSGVEEVDGTGKYLVPSFIDGHVHLESSIVSPSQYAKAALPHGTAAVVADPHEIVNVLGKIGWEYMLAASANLPLDVYFTLPSCVPATPFDETGATVTSADIAAWLKEPRVLGLAEMMNYPAVLAQERDVLRKLVATQRAGKRIDGHAPSLTGKSLNAYIAAGVRSDHECTSAEEGKEKIRKGQWVMVREGTASHNVRALLPLFEKPYCDRCMLVTDDKHAGELIREGHIDHIVRLAIALGAPVVNAYKMASYNAATYFGLIRNGALAPDYFADFLVLDDLETVSISAVYKRGKRVEKLLQTFPEPPVNAYDRCVRESVHVAAVTAKDFALKKAREKVIGLVEGEILTTDEGYAESVDTAKDICKLAVLERHKGTGHIGVAFVKGYGLQRGAVATSVSHDSHNLIVVGVNDGDMAYAVSELRRMQGGMVVVDGGKTLAALPLPIAGLMSDLEGDRCERELLQVKAAAHSLGVKKSVDPFMTLSFASLAVIPTLRLTTLGVVDVEKFTLLP